MPGRVAVRSWPVSGRSRVNSVPNRPARQKPKGSATLPHMRPFRPQELVAQAAQRQQSDREGGRRKRHRPDRHVRAARRYSNRLYAISASSMPKYTRQSDVAILVVLIEVIGLPQLQRDGQRAVRLHAQIERLRAASQLTGNTKLRCGIGRRANGTRSPAA